MPATKKINIKYFASLREQADKSSDSFDTTAGNVKDIYDEIAKKYSFSLGFDQVRVAVNDNFANADYSLQDGDTVVFIPPVAGG